jgi:hypothetical protein
MGFKALVWGEGLDQPQQQQQPRKGSIRSRNGGSFVGLVVGVATKGKADRGGGRATKGRAMVIRAAAAECRRKQGGGGGSSGSAHAIVAGAAPEGEMAAAAVVAQYRWQEKHFINLVHTQVLVSWL